MYSLRPKKTRYLLRGLCPEPGDAGMYRDGEMMDGAAEEQDYLSFLQCVCNVHCKKKKS